MKKTLIVKVENEEVVEYDLGLFENHIDEIYMKSMSEEIGALAVSKIKNQIVLKNYTDLVKLNNLLVGYLEKK